MSKLSRDKDGNIIPILSREQNQQKKPINKRLTNRQWNQAIVFYKSGNSVATTCKKYKVTPQAFYRQLRIRGIKKGGLMSVEEFKKIERGSFLTTENVETNNMIENILNDDEVKQKVEAVRDVIDAIPRKERALMSEVIVEESKDSIKRAILNKTEELDTYVKMHKLDKVETEDIKLHFKVYDEVLNILKDKNPVLAKNLSALVGKIMLKANDILDDPKIKSHDLNNVANALCKVNDIMQIIPKTQPLIAQQFNIGNNTNQAQVKKDFDVKVKFI